MLLIIHILKKGGKKKKEITQSPVRHKEMTVLPEERLRVKFRLGKSDCDSIELLPDYS